MSLGIQSQKKIRKMKAKWKVESWEDYEKMENSIMKKILQNKEPNITGNVRIIAGKAKNCLLDIPRNTRPLTDRLKTTIFDVLGSDIYKKNILDLYAGAGSFGLEAISRGAKSATFVDTSKSAAYILNNNIEKTGFLEDTIVIKQKVEDFLGEKENLKETYDLIFLDPPYKKFNTKHFGEIENILNVTKTMLPGFKKGNKKKFKGAIILKHPRRYPLEKLDLTNLVKIETYNFGLNAVSIYIVKLDI
jgi:16S rRNA (guanine(966)-N(2))-methyltransferase RsmD